MSKNPKPKQPDVMEWEKTVQYAADHGYYAMHTALVEDGPDPEINYSALREDPAPQPQAGQQPQWTCGKCGVLLEYGHVCEAAQPQPEPAKCKHDAHDICGICSPEAFGERVEGKEHNPVTDFFWEWAKDNSTLVPGEQWQLRFAEAYAAHQLAERESREQRLREALQAALYHIHIMHPQPPDDVTILPLSKCEYRLCVRLQEALNPSPAKEPKP